MMRSEGKITRGNAFDIIKKFAKEYRKELGKVPGEIIFVGGGSIMLNYKFRDATQDFDVILKTVSGVKDVIAKFADDNDLPRDWMNSDFIKTASYSSVLSEVYEEFFLDSQIYDGKTEIDAMTNIVILPISRIKQYMERESRYDFSMVVIDEIHYFKNSKSVRYGYLNKLLNNIGDSIRIFMSATPVNAGERSDSRSGGGMIWSCKHKESSISKSQSQKMTNHWKPFPLCDIMKHHATNGRYPLMEPYATTPFP